MNRMAFVGFGFGRKPVRMGWRRLDCGGEYLQLERVLQRGMAFRWREIERDRVWAGVVKQRMVVLRQERDSEGGSQGNGKVEYLVGKDEEEGDALESDLVEYFNLEVPAKAMAKEFVRMDEKFAAVEFQLRGTRVLRLDPVECLFSFICSSNNNIKRIMQMVNHLAERYGRYIDEYGGYSFHTFPTIDELCAEVNEEDLRANGFGYRARYIVETAHALKERGGERWLLDLRERDRAHVSTELVQLTGVGKKVASCIALFSLDKYDEIPIDTHIWKMTVSHYMPKMKGKTLTDKVYDTIGDFYRERFGENAGWAHTVLFGAQLDAYRAGSNSTKEERQEPMREHKRKKTQKPSTTQSTPRRTNRRLAKEELLAEDVKPAKAEPEVVVVQKQDCTTKIEAEEIKAEVEFKPVDVVSTSPTSQQGKDRATPSTNSPSPSPTLSPISTNTQNHSIEAICSSSVHSKDRIDHHFQKRKRNRCIKQTPDTHSD